MQKLTCREIIEATSGTLVSGDIDTVFFNISIDSRSIQDGDLFIPIVGERFDGHDFINSSLSAGACGVITQKQISPIEKKVVIKVEDTAKALRDIAAFYRKKFNIPVIAITGSVGKTSTKDMISSVLSQNLNILKTEGNFNNEIGLPLTMLRLDSFHQAAVIEMGMSGIGEISRLTSIARPDIAVITNIGLAHIEKLGSRQNILKAKMEILEGLSNRGIVILNGDDKLLFGMKDLLPFRTVFFGTEEEFDYTACDIKNAGENGTYFSIVIKNTEYKVHVPVPGMHNVNNALCAIAVGLESGIPMEKILQGILEFRSGKMRLDIINHKSLKIINDSYNANPQSMEAAINVLKDISGNNRTVAVLGDMLEMGEWAAKAHADIGKFAVSKDVDYIITIGENAGHIAEGAINAGKSQSKLFSFKNMDELLEFIKDFITDGDCILVKGSRGMKMERVVEFITNEI